MAGPDFLATTHPAYDQNEDLWRRNERRMRGGPTVPMNDLWRFAWEKEGDPDIETFTEGSERELQQELEKHLARESSDHYKRRIESANYVNLPKRMATSFVGRLLMEAPVPNEDLDFGTLGEIGQRDGRGNPNRATQFFVSTDRPQGGATWPAFWYGVSRRAMATGHRWIFVEAPEQNMNQPSRGDELRGFRPYLVEYSPLSVKDWHYENGVLQFARIEFTRRQFNRTGNRTDIQDNARMKLLLVRQGWTAFGDEYAEGGWWMFDGNGDPIEDDDGQQKQGSWNNTEGAIPLVPIFYERNVIDSPDDNSISRPATTEVGNIAVTHMNLDSAADSDAFDAASRIIWMLNASPDVHKKAADQLKSGSQIVGVPPQKMGQEQEVKLEMLANMSANEALEARMEKKIENGRLMMMEEATSVPESSGLSKRLGFRDVKAPRLALMATNTEDAQTPAIRFVERRWGSRNPSGSVTWPTDFDLEPLQSEIERIMGAMQQGRVNSPELKAELVMSAVRESGIWNRFSEEQQDTIGEELRASARAATREQLGNRDFFGPTNGSTQQSGEAAEEGIVSTSGEGGEQ